MNHVDIDANVPVAVMLNKTDIPTAVGEDFIAETFSIQTIRTGKVWIFVL